MLKLEWLEAFAAFAEHLSFTRAAKALHLSQPALHVQVKKLSEELGAPLYERKGQRLILTADGVRVASFGREIRERTRDLAEALAPNGRTEPVVLCAGEGAYLYLLGDGLRKVLAEGAKLRLLTRDREGTLDAVRAGDAHVGVAALEVLPADLDAHLLTEVEQALVMPKGHPLARKRAVRLVDLAGTRLVVPPEGRPHRDTIKRALRDAGVAWEVAVEANGWELIVRFAELGVGLAVVNACCRIPRGLVARPIQGLPSQRYYVLRRKRAPNARAGASATAELVRALVAHGATWKERRG